VEFQEGLRQTAYDKGEKLRARTRRPGVGFGG
jgi:5-(carboxyamino)imidazole ribonucleotide mutase